MGSAEEQHTTAVVLDVGGVLMDWDPRYLFDKLIPDEHTREWFLQEVCSPEWNLAQDWGRSWDEAVAEAIARYPEYEEWIRAFDERWLETIGDLHDATVTVLRELRAGGTPVYALTNFSAQKWDLACEHIDVLREFSGAVVSGKEQVGKPDERIFRIVLERFELTPARTFYTDDQETNVQAARAVGIDAELFTDAATLAAQLADRGLLGSGAGADAER